MIIRMKDALKLAGITIVMFCAVFVCNLFLNFNLDLNEIAPQITGSQMQILYDAMILTGKMIAAVSGGCLLITSMIMLCFYIKHYIDMHKQELGILKAMGYGNWQLATHFWIFGCSVLIGGAIGYGTSFLLMPKFYEVQNADQLLPEVVIHFHFELMLFLVILPAIIFSCLAIYYAHHKLTGEVMELLKENEAWKKKKPRQDKAALKERPFLKEVQHSTLKSRKTLQFFVFFASFCFSSMMQMTSSMGELASEMFAVMVFIIGVILSCTTLFMALATLIHANTKTISMMRVFGYSFHDCRNAILNGYRPLAAIGFITGTLYQYGLFQFMVNVIFKDVDQYVAYEFNWLVFFGVLIAFVVLYEGAIHVYAARIKRISLKEVMIE